MGFLNELLEIGRLSPERTAIRYGKKNITYNELSNQLKSVALQVSYHHPPQTRISFACKPSLESVALALGLMYAGNILIILDTTLPTEVFRHQVEETETTVIVADPGFYLASKTRSLLRLLNKQPVADISAAANVEKAVFDMSLHGWKRWLNYSSISSRYENVTDPELPAVIMYTMGGDEPPKAITHTRKTLSANMDCVVPQLDVQPGATVFTENMVVGVTALAKGATWVIPDSNDVPETDLWFTTPSDALKSLDNGSVGKVKHVALTSATTTPSVVLELSRKLGPTTKLSSVYTTTEMFPIAVGDARRKPEFLEVGDYVGQIVGETETRIVNGELWVKGQGVAKPLHMPDEEWIKTGDHANLTDEGNLILKGKHSDIILRDTLPIYPAGHEAAITLIPGVREAVLTQHPNGTVILALTATPGYNLDAVVRKVKGLTTKTLPSEAVPDQVIGFSQFPVTGPASRWDRASIISKVINGANV